MTNQFIIIYFFKCEIILWGNKIDLSYFSAPWFHCSNLEMNYKRTKVKILGGIIFTYIYMHHNLMPISSICLIICITYYDYTLCMYDKDERYSFSYLKLFYWIQVYYAVCFNRNFLTEIKRILWVYELYDCRLIIINFFYYVQLVQYHNVFTHHNYKSVLVYVKVRTYICMAWNISWKSPNYII